MSDPLRQWMKEEGVWQLDLYNMLSNMDIVTKEDLRKLPEKRFNEVVKEAKTTGFMHAAELRAIYKNEPISKKEASPVQKSKTPKENKSEVTKNLKRVGGGGGALPTYLQSPKKKKDANKVDIREDEKEANNRDMMKRWMEKHQIWQKSLYDVFVKYNVSTPKDLVKMDESSFNDLLRDAKQNGLMGEKIDRLIGVRKNKSLEEIEASLEQKNKRYNDEKTKRTEHRTIETARANLKPWLEEHEIWQKSLLDVFVEFDCYSVNDFKALDEDTFEQFMVKTKHVGLMGNKPQTLRDLYLGKSSNNNQNKNNNASHNKNKPLTPHAETTKSAPKKSREEELSEVRGQLEPWMRKKGFWQKDLFEALFDKNVRRPSDLKNLSREDITELLHTCKLKGFIGKGPVTLEETWKQQTQK
ncbi:hypothetical protein RFI_31411 [Reticulomyxa filosa]|uniref:Uncharacterized protein n=1 Tax=Reticulomyxa filosa TaxID=46433 RepID=X6LZ28_RETFI|nr:hypothetical protein RFI_31411 [Reticulomyxa filosa]|eukprot:ETO05985.1 hypothetical protein RFI_31411 [Reticulomyxa filosa]